MRINLTLLLQVAGVMHLGLMSAGLLMPQVVNMRAHLAGLPAFIRQLFWVYYSFIALCLVGFSVITIVFAETLASGSTLARALCVFFAVFWTMRLFVATFGRVRVCGDPILMEDRLEPCVTHQYRVSRFLKGLLRIAAHHRVGMRCVEHCGHVGDPFDWPYRFGVP